jgi:anaerobic magnesium-protoporphyrin IX monomethyl ester cyclase
MESRVYPGSTPKMTRKKIALITTHQIDLGIRTLAGSLKGEIDYVLINLSTRNQDFSSKYPEQVIEQVSDLIKDCDFIGFSAIDLHFQRTTNLAQQLRKRSGIPVIFGGIHAIMYPEECIKYADAVCIGEGDISLKELILNWDSRYTSIKSNFWLRRGRNIMRLRRERLITELDKLPMPDFSSDKYFALFNNRLVNLHRSSHRPHLEHHQIGHKNTIVYASDRGCPNSCSYCYNRNLREIFRCPGKEYLRQKSVARIITELKKLKEDSPGAEFLNLMNDDTAARTEKDIQKFSKMYKKEIGLPFYCMVSPQTITDNKIRNLIAAGCVELNMGIQTNETVNCGMYQRFTSDALILAKVKMLNKYHNKIKLFYDFIINNPGETEEQTVMTINLIKQIPIPFDVVTHNLCLGKGSALYQRFKKQGIITKHSKIFESDYHDFSSNIEEYRHNRNFYANLIMEWISGLHNKKRIGRLPREKKDLASFKPFEPLFKKSDFNTSFNESEEVSTLDFLLSDDVKHYLKEKPEVLCKIHAALPTTLHSNSKNAVAVKGQSSHVRTNKK